MVDIKSYKQLFNNCVFAMLRDMLILCLLIIITLLSRGWVLYNNIGYQHRKPMVINIYCRDMNSFTQSNYLFNLLMYNKLRYVMNNLSTTLR